MFLIIIRLETAIFWHRRDLRLEDNAGLFKALKSGFEIVPLFIFDKNILDDLEEKRDARVLFIHQELRRLQAEYRKLGSELKIYYGFPEAIWKEIISLYRPKKVFFNRDYEPYALSRDLKIYEFLKSENIEAVGAKDHVIFEKSEITKDDGKPYTVFTPYMKKWKAALGNDSFKSFDTSSLSKYLKKQKASEIPSLEEMGFENFEFEFPSRDLDLKILNNYAEKRDIPSVRGTSRMSLHLRFGTVSIRKLCKVAATHSEKWLNELIWRDFYQMIMYQFPHSINASFKPQYDRIPWINSEKDFEAWKNGKTGYPIVDAGMRELNSTGFMHNRVRMIVASFLTKHLLIDWKWGESYFAQKLLDFELASNVGGWQWAASSGCDAAPYFRVFSPAAQEEKFDPDQKYIRKWISEFGSSQYPKPIVEHKMARQRAIDTYKLALNP